MRDSFLGLRALEILIGTKQGHGEDAQGAAAGQAHAEVEGGHSMAADAWRRWGVRRQRTMARRRRR